MAEQDQLIRETPYLGDDGNPRTQFEYDPLTEETGWDIETFKKKYDGHKELMQTDQVSFSKMMFGSTTPYVQDPVKIVEFQDQVRRYSQKGTLDFGRKRSKNLADLILESEEGEKILFEQIVSQFPAYDGGDEFGNVSKTMKKSSEKIKEIAKDPVKYLQGMAKDLNLSPIAQMYFSSFGDRIIQDLLTEQNNNVVRAVREYGVSNYIASNIQNAYEAGQKQDEELGNLEKRLNERAESFGETPTEEQISELQKLKEELDEEAKKVIEKYQNASKVWAAMSNSLMEVTRGYIAQKEATEKKAAEKKK